MDKKLNLNAEGEIYWILDRVLESLGFFKQFSLDEYPPHEQLLVLSTLTLAGLVNDKREIKNFLQKVDEYKWKSRIHTLAFYLGALSIMYIDKRIGNKLSYDHLFYNLKELNEMIKKFHEKNDRVNLIDALFIESLIINLLRLFLDVSYITIYNKSNLKDIYDILENIIHYISDTSISNIDKIKLAYSFIELHNVINDRSRYENIKTCMYGILNYLGTINLEFRSFLLKIFTSFQLIRERQVVLNSLANEIKNHPIFKSEKELFKKLITNIISAESYDTVKYEEKTRVVTLNIEFPEEKFENIVQPNLIQLSILALALMVTGYHDTYTLPLIEKNNYENFTNIIKESGNGTKDRLLIIDRLELEKQVFSFLKEIYWPIYMYKVILQFSLFIFLSILLGLFSKYFLYLENSYIIGLGGVVISIVGNLLIILKNFIDVTNVDKKEAVKVLWSKNYKQNLLEGLMKKLIKRLVLQRWLRDE